MLGAIAFVALLFALRGGNSDRSAGPAPDVRETLLRKETDLQEAEAIRNRQTVGEDVDEVDPGSMSQVGFFDIAEHAGLRVQEQVNVGGRVIDVSGLPVGGVEVCAMRPGGLLERNHEVVPAAELARVTADASGRFEIEALVPVQLTVQDELYATMYEGMVTHPEQEVLVIVGQRIPLAGVVVDENGLAIEGVRVTVQALSTPRELDLSGSMLVVPQVFADIRGRFAFESAFEVERAQIQFQAAGFVTLLLDVPPGGAEAMQIVMSHEAEGLYTISGRVVLEDGSPACGAQVSTGVMASPTDAQGRFVIDFEPWLSRRVNVDAPTVVTAVLKGHLPGSRTLPSVSDVRKSGWPEEIVIELAGEPLTLRGIVVDADGEPVRGALLEPLDMSDFGLVAKDGLPAYSGSPMTQEQLAGGAEAVTTADGRFALGGLFDRDYSIGVLLRPSLAWVVTEPIPADSQAARIVVDRGVIGTIEGRVVDRMGVGIGGMRVSVSRKRIAELVIGNSAVSYEHGLFRINEVTTEPEFLRLEGDAIVPELFRELEPGDDVNALVLEVERRCRIQFDWGQWPAGDRTTSQDELIVVDDRGEQLTMMHVQGGGFGEIPSVPSQQGLTDVLLVSDAAAHAIVHRSGNELLRIPLDLIAAELNMVRL